MKSIKHFLILALILIPIIGVYCYFNKFDDIPKSRLTIEEVKEDMRSAIILPSSPSAISEVNERNSKIKTFICEDVNIKFLQKGIRMRLNGKMYYEKDKKFRFVISSILGKEVDVGSNENEFWLWSKRMNPSSLFFAKHEDFYKSRMRTPFSPFLLMDSLGVGNLNIDSGKIVETNKSYIWVEPGKNSIGQPISRMTFINKKNKLIDGFTICNESGSVIASGEIIEYKNEIPKQILYVWAEENLSMLMDLKNPKINTNLNFNIFNRPDIHPQVDMGKN